jgi:hypothetical protein
MPARIANILSVSVIFPFGNHRRYSITSGFAYSSFENLKVIFTDLKATSISRVNTNWYEPRLRASGNVISNSHNVTVDNRMHSYWNGLKNEILKYGNRVKVIPPTLYGNPSNTNFYLYFCLGNPRRRNDSVH